MIINILKSGEVVTDITGHIPSREEVPTFYDIAERMKEKSHEEN